MLAVQIAARTVRADKSDKEIIGLIRRKLFEGKLSEDLAHLVCGGFAGGYCCAACELPIDAGNPAIDCYGKDRVQRLYHPKCHILLSLEIEGLAQR